MRKLSRVTLAALAVASAAATPALAHTGTGAHTHGFLAGIMHPLGGLDHLLAMLSVGIWSALAMRGRSVLIAPATFVAAMLAGAGMGVGSLPLPMVETGIALSVVALGLMILTRIELPVAAGAALVALFALYHGHAHGSEATGTVAAYLAGFALTTAMLHVSGIAFGSALARVEHASRFVGAAIAASGAYILAS